MTTAIVYYPDSCYLIPTIYVESFACECQDGCDQDWHKQAGFRWLFWELHFSF
jgi:hypothetical protein